MMSGYNKCRFVDLNDTDIDELTCGICFNVFRDPIETNCCRKTFCNFCIKDWINRNNTCPNDRNILNRNDLIGSSKIVLNMLAKLKIKCEFSENGCPNVVSLDSLTKHTDECNYNKCKNCGETMVNMNDHNCEHNLMKRVNQLRNYNQILNKRVYKLKSKSSKLESTLIKHNIIVCFKCSEEGHKAPQCSIGNVSNKVFKQPKVSLNTNENTNEFLSINEPININQQNVSNDKSGENSYTFEENEETIDRKDNKTIEGKTVNGMFYHENESDAKFDAHVENKRRHRFCPICSMMFDITVSGADVNFEMHIKAHSDGKNQLKQCRKQDAQTSKSKTEIRQTKGGVCKIS